MNNETQQLRDEIGALRSEVNDLKAIVFKNNFSSTQVFSKASIFNDRLKVPSYTTAPRVAEVNDIIGIAGVLYICTIAGNVASPATFTLVGTQS